MGLPLSSSPRVAPRRERVRGARVVFDNNYRPRLWADVQAARAAYRKVLAEVDIALLTEDDEHALFGYEDSEQVFAAYP